MGTSKMIGNPALMASTEWKRGRERTTRDSQSQPWREDPSRSTLASVENLPRTWNLTQAGFEDLGKSTHGAFPCWGGEKQTQVAQVRIGISRRDKIDAIHARDFLINPDEVENISFYPKIFISDCLVSYHLFGLKNYTYNKYLKKKIMITNLKLDYTDPIPPKFSTGLNNHLFLLLKVRISRTT